ncbi:MAG: sprT domain-containing protein [Flavobacteriales bacterium]|nr:sprT domain-containing protein [Flavobacteriales bacterium]MCC6938442.1 sprT domain-containing protein [Flavobacteriales bacterium]
MRATDTEAIRSRLPEAAWPVVMEWLREEPVRVNVTRPRRTKLGDFRSAVGAGPHRISVNGDLNPFSFLVTLVHEFAHHGAFQEHKGRIAPHGVEWKAEYKRRMRPFMSAAVLPPDVLLALELHLLRAPASSCTDHRLSRTLKRYDPGAGPHLEDLSEGSIFKFHTRLFVKGPRLRKRFRCNCLNDGRQYLFDPMVEVITIPTVPLALAS